MAISRQVTCINKVDRYNPHERIQYIGGSWGKTSNVDAINQIRSGLYEYYVQIGLNKVLVIIGNHNGNPYLKTQADTTTVDNLLSLPTCP